jgi:hypothetical protein
MDESDSNNSNLRLVGNISASIHLIDLLAAVDQPSSWINDHYLVRVRWWPDNSIAAQIQNRDQDQLLLLRIDPRTSTRLIAPFILNDPLLSSPSLFCYYRCLLNRAYRNSQRLHQLA